MTRGNKNKPTERSKSSQGSMNEKRRRKDTMEAAIPRTVRKKSAAAGAPQPSLLSGLILPPLAAPSPTPTPTRPQANWGGGGGPHPNQQQHPPPQGYNNNNYRYPTM